MEIQEADFKLSELFFSKTDFKGLIQSGNDVFVRVSEYKREELYRRPHNIIRHSDMPATVFKLLWDFLKSSRPIAAYVKNKSKTGRFYWVFAMVFPLEDGYISVRLKPTSHFFPLIKDLYRELLDLETQGLKHEQGLEWLLQKLKALGYSSYEQFMSDALLEELKSRDGALGNLQEGHSPPTCANESLKKLLEVSSSCTHAARSAFQRVGELQATTHKLLSTTQAILDVCHHVKMITTNLTITSSKLGESGKPLSVVSTNLEKLCADISQSSSQFETVFGEFQASVAAMYFAVGTSRFQIEMMNHLMTESLNPSEGSSEDSLTTNCTLLKKLITRNFKAAEDAADKLVVDNKALLQSVAALSKVIAGMDVICVVGKIEMARIQELSTSLESLLEEIEKLTANFKDSLKMMDSECKSGLRHTGALRTLLDKISFNLNKIEQFLSA